MGNLISKKRKTDSENMTYYVYPSYNGKNVNVVYDELANKYTYHKIFVLSNPLTSTLVDKRKTVLIYCNHEDNTVKSVEIYD